MTDKQTFGQDAIIDFEIDEHEALKPLPKEVRSETIKSSVEAICKKYGVTMIENIGPNINNISITGFTNVSQGDDFLYDLNEHTMLNINKIIESLTGDDPSDYYRNYILFESQFEVDTLILTWS